MKRLHVHVAVGDLNQSTKFYTSLFGSEPAVQKDDYVKWMLEDPRINFAISARGREPGLDHMGIQVENQSELKEVSARLKSADVQVLDEGATTCCYAESEKAWVVDPQGIAWETFLTTGSATIYGTDNDVSTAEIPMAKNSACCAPSLESVPVSISKKD
ncbi:MAG: VOC family protein [Candidatus Melainabacteria bacterium]|jgi:catechol-2,3-dioxygenase|nr:VOC family protein [Candidatus Melainabacteria bacterium]